MLGPEPSIGHTEPEQDFKSTVAEAGDHSRLCGQGAGEGSGAEPEQLDCGAAHLQHPLKVVTVAYGEPVHHVMQFDPADPGYLYLMTSHQMARVKVAACAVHTTCGDCVGAADAYCGCTGSGEATKCQTAVSRAGKQMNLQHGGNCTSCLSAQWPCFWCTQQHSCVSNQSRCEASPNPTAMFEKAPLWLHGAGGTGKYRAGGADLTLPNPHLPKGAALECSFGQEEIFEAVWLHTTQKSQVFPLSLQLKGRPARFLDSPDHMADPRQKPQNQPAHPEALENWPCTPPRASLRRNPVITAISPRRSHVSGGRTITVAGERFHMVQKVSMAVHHIGREPTLCKVLNSTLITCPSPGALSNASAPVDFFLNGRAYADEAAVDEELLDPEEAQRGSRFRLDYLPDPQFSTAKREKWIKHHPGEPLTLVIHKEQDGLGLESHEYRVKIGQVACDIQIVSERVIHCSVNESLGTAEGQLPITIQVGNFNQTIATLQLGGSETAIIVSIVICSVLLLLSVVALFVFCTKSRRAERYWQKTLLQMEEMESQIREEIRKGFAELQTDMTDLTKELNRSQGIPFLEYKHFVTRTFFPKIPESCRPNMEEGISLFSSLLNNKHFLIVFVHALEQQKDFAELLVDLIDASAAKNPKLMLRRTESVVEKMLTNWMSICMYSCLRETVGEPFFLLLCAIKQQINKGSIDAITGKARYTLNEEWLLRENIEAKPRNLNVSFQGCGMDSLSVRAMDTDTLTQVKEKILEAFCKNVPYSQWPRAEDDGRKKLNTLAHYKIPEGASLAMSLTDKKDNTLGRVKDLDTEKYFHLVLPTDELAEPKKSHRQSHRKKVLPEIYLTRLLSTKGTLQKFLDDLFKAILSIREDKPPLAVKYFFDFLEEQAEKRGISDPDTLHIWKTNSLPLRFWVNILKNPQFVFDIEKTDHIDACLSVIAQAFIDACSISDLQLGKDSPTNKLLYAKEIPEYRKIVQRYYKQIHDMTPLSEQEMNAHLAEESRKYQNEFNTNVAMAEIYKYAKRYRPQIMSALEANPTARRTQLQHKFEQVVALMEDNIYECYSEA
ncbi:hypothetical protein E2I00_013180 [Balaenoptera physalus]|uniref:Sema domain-containing protein n=1 Tax=Balaenoptera physalus TaxID=9770 RepID=A0A6A1QD19_BALPH|nr:hypothetical protein E2I00_013180 [Balaenoptera physalus]